MGALTEFEETVKLLAAAGGELKNMLSVLKMATDLLQPHIENIGNQNLDTYVAMLYHCFYKMLRLADNMSALEAITRGDKSLDLSSFDLVAAGRELAGSVDHLVSDSGARVCFESNEEALMIYADRLRLDQMLVNLISNSLQNTPRGGLVTITVVAASDRAVISVNDNGAGIRGEVLPTVWDRYKEEKATANRAGGIGLGLTIVQNIARLHGGSAVLESRPDGGAAVTISLPLITPAETDRGTSIAIASCGMQLLLTGLSGVLGCEKYTQLYMD